MALARTALARALTTSRHDIAPCTHKFVENAKLHLPNSRSARAPEASLLWAQDVHSCASSGKGIARDWWRCSRQSLAPSQVQDHDGVTQRPWGHACSTSTVGRPSKSHRERRLMAFSPSELFSVVSDVDSYQEFVPWCRQSYVTRRLEGGKYEADLVVGFQVFQERYTSIVTAEEPSLVHSEAADSQLFHHLITRWEIRPGPNRSTSWVTFSVDFSFKNMLYAHTASLFFDQVVSKMIGAFDTRCRQIYRSSAARAA